MESELKPKVIHKYSRRWPQLQEASVTRFDDVVVASASSGDHKEGSKKEHPSKALRHPYQPARKKRKKKADSSNSESYTPRSHIRGRVGVSRVGSNSITMEGKLDSKAFELYFENIWSRAPEEKRDSFAYLDCLWFNLYTQNFYKEKVLNWIKKKDVFSKKYVLVPIVMWSHWSLLILCDFVESPESKSKSPCMLLLDSLQSANQSLEPWIRKFLLDLYKMEGRSANRESIQKIPFLVPKVPQQRNGEECGCYVLFYVKLFLENAPKSLGISEGYPHFMKEEWFTVESLDNFCQMLGSIPTESSSSDE